ncbi:MAG: Ig-like domain-containing protein [Butyrivibrio sp.]|nr:Ig-like domain-containing protein [Butyrivibrio sp.]
MKKRLLAVLLSGAIFVGNAGDVLAAENLTQAPSESSSEETSVSEDSSDTENSSEDEEDDEENTSPEDEENNPSDEPGKGTGSGEEGDDEEGGSEEGDTESSSEASSESSSDAALEASSETLVTEGETDKDKKEYATGYLEDDRDYEIESVMDAAPGEEILVKAGEMDSQHVTEYLPLLRDQNPYPTCWAFATTALADIYLCKENHTTDVDLSELHLAYFTYNSVEDPLGGTNGDVGSNSGLNLGNGSYAASKLDNWVGPAYESTADYKRDGERADKIGLPSGIAYDAAVHLKNYYEEPIEKKADKIAQDKHANIKQLVMDYGAAAISFYAKDAYSSDFDTSIFNAETNAYYNPSRHSTSHELVIVGWDDNFSKSNFVKTPQGDGAFLVRNSWKDGTDTDYKNNMGYDGYFWMSYYEATFGDYAAAAEFEPVSERDNNYQYDGGIANTLVGGYDRVANVFTAHADGGFYGESLNAVSFATAGSNLDYTIEIYTDPEVSEETGLVTDPESGNKVDEATTTGTTTYSGRYTVYLNNPVTLSKGQRFSVVLSLKKGDFEGDYLKERLRNDGYINYSVSSEAGQSFVHRNSIWTDDGRDHGGNLRIKAFTKNLPAGSIVPPTSISFTNVTDNKLKVGIGETFKVNTSILPEDATDRTLTWTSDTPEVATVSNGLIVGVKAGEAVITAKANKGEAQQSITVTVGKKASSVEINALFNSVKIGEEGIFACSVYPSDKEIMDKVEWSTTTPELLSIVETDSNIFYASCKAKALALGEATLTASVDDVSDSITISCEPGTSSYGYDIADDNTVTIWWKYYEGATDYVLKRNYSAIYNETVSEAKDIYSYEDDFFKKNPDATSTDYQLVQTINGVTYTSTISVSVKGSKISYVLNGGTQDSRNSQRYVEGYMKTLYPPTPPEGYEFDGWYTSPTFEANTKKTYIESKDRGAITLYAKYVKTLVENAVTGIEILDAEGASVGGEIERGTKISLSAKVSPAAAEQGYEWGETLVYPVSAATVTSGANNTLEITAKEVGTVTVSAKSTADPSKEAVRTFIIKDILPKSIVLTKAADADIDDLTDPEAVGIKLEDEEKLKKSVTLTSTVYNELNPVLEGADISAPAKDQKVSWISSNEGVAQVTVDEIDDRKAEITPIAKGTAYVYAVSELDSSVRTGYRVVVTDAEGASEKGHAGELQITSTGKKPVIYASSKSDVNRQELELASGKSASVKAVFIPEKSGDKIADKTVNWHSGNSSVASISAAGKIVAKSAGEAVITATAQDRELVAAFRVKVYDPVTSFAIDKKAVKMGMGQQAVITAKTLLPATADSKLTCASSNRDVAYAEQSGTGEIVVHSGNKAGKAVITIKTAHGEKSAKCTVTVGRAVTSISVTSKGSVSAIAAGKTLQMTASFNGGVKVSQPANKDITWEILHTEDEKDPVATINAKGVVTAKREGTVDIVARSTTDRTDKGQQVASNIFTLKVYVPVKKAALNKSTVSIAPGKTFDLEAVITPSVALAPCATGSAVGVDVKNEISWSYKNKAFEASDPLGIKNAAKGGKCTLSVKENATATKSPIEVMAKLRPYGAKKDTVLTCKVSVASGFLKKVTFSSTKIKLDRGAEATVTAAFDPVVPSDDSIEWTIADDSRDKISFVKEDGTKCAQADFYMSGKDAPGSISKDNKVTIRAEADHGAGAFKATIYAQPKGQLSNGKLMSPVKITVELAPDSDHITLYQGKTKKTWSAELAGNIRQQNIVTIPTGKSVTMKAVMNSYQNGKPGNNKVLWKSSDPSIAVVSASGKITGKKSGAVTITAYSQDSYTVTVDGEIVKKPCAEEVLKVLVYDTAKKVTLDKKKADMSTGVGSTTKDSSFSQYQMVTATVSPDSIYDNVTESLEEFGADVLFDDKNGLTWTIDKGTTGKIAAYAIDTNKVSKADGSYNKQNILSVYNSEYKELASGESVKTGRGQSLAIKALSPGTVKLTATAPGGKKATCVITVHSHVTGAELKLNWDAAANDGNGAYTADVTKTVTINKKKETVKVISKERDEAAGTEYTAFLDKKLVKRVTLKPVLNYMYTDAEGNVTEVLYSDKKDTAQHKAETAVYNAVKKSAVNSAVSFRSLNPKVVTVNAKGAITAKGNGTAVIVMTTADGGVEKKIKVVVEDK